MSRKRKEKDLDSGREDLSTKSIELEEIDYELDSDPELENNADLIKYEFNMIELPFFSKDKKIEKGTARKYIFSKKDNSYMLVSPSGKPGLISNKILQEFDEKIFYGIMKLSKEQKSQQVITDYFTLAKISGVKYNHLIRIKDSLQRLRNTIIDINNLFYNAELRTRMNKNKEFNILQDKEEYDFDKIQNLSVDMQEKYSNCFRNSKITEILILTLSDPIYKNIEKKGFLYFEQKKLIEIDNSTTRKIYVMVTKWKGYEKKNAIKRSCRFIASRVPLSWERKNIGNSVRIIEKACQTLKESGLLKDYLFGKTKPVGDSYIIFMFNENHNKIDIYNTKASRAPTGHEEMIIDTTEDEYVDERQTDIFDISREQDLKKKEQELKEKAAEIMNSLAEKEKALLINRARNSMQYDHYKYKIEQKIITEEELLNEVILLIIEKDIEDGIIQ